MECKAALLAGCVGKLIKSFMSRFGSLLLRQQSLSSGEEENLGAVNCSLHYNKETHLLAVNIIQAVDLVPKDFSGTANPYCKVSLLPVHRSQLQTKVHHKTLEPKFDEEFIFDVSPQKLKPCCLEILIFNYDQFSRHECVGQVKLMLENIDLTEKVDLWKGISHYEKQKNPFVKVSVILKGRKIKKKKTSTVHSSLNPVWNEALSFSIARDIVKDVSLELTVCHENKLGNDDILGHVRLSADADGDERVHWNDLVSFRSAVARKKK
ncbi:hypothetical protein KUTeg_021591 [Tegillarca granosa]|uniref:C2 domain-containing protein n=1 Tax=Tegillarca granosa TaxID=220873 RepID=A0ABQ9E942_TEGGR|nr:hypothetical protein KUTeg_021591 [Tegillarca granosa]